MNLFSSPGLTTSLGNLSTKLAVSMLITLVFGVFLPTSAKTHESTNHVSTTDSAQHKQQSAFYRFKIGDINITALSDGTVPQDLHSLLKGISPDEIDTILDRDFMVNPLETSINAYLIELGNRIVLVDTGAGFFFAPNAGGKLLTGLHSIGYQADQITDILVTHIHTDHSGGLTDEHGDMVFQNATVHIGQPDIDFFLDPANQNGVNGYDKIFFEQATQSLQPYVKANKVKGFQSSTEIIPGIKAIPTPGHTPGHAFFVLESKGETLEFIGDTLHVQSIQMPRPEITIIYDVEQAKAKSQREAQFARLAQDRHMIAGAHLPFPGLGHIRQENTGFTYVPINYHNR